MKIGLLGITFIVLLILKLVGVISISWLWVFSPLLIGGVLLALGLFGIAAAAGFGSR